LNVPEALAGWPECHPAPGPLRAYSSYLNVPEALAPDCRRVGRRCLRYSSYLNVPEALAAILGGVTVVKGIKCHGITAARTPPIAAI
jgi:hypothetical protein